MPTLPNVGWPDWAVLAQIIGTVIGFATLIAASLFNASRQRTEARLARELVIQQAEAVRQAAKDQADAVRIAAKDQAEVVRLAVAEAEKRLFNYHQLIIGKLDDNTSLTARAVEVAGEAKFEAVKAFKESNSINHKIELIGLQTKDGSVLGHGEIKAAEIHIDKADIKVLKTEK